MVRRVSAYALSGLVALLWAAAGHPVSAEDQPNPFPSPSASVTPVGGNGFAALGYYGGGANGGLILPQAGTNNTPAPFPASGASGFWINITGRISASYLAEVLFDSYATHGGDRPFVSVAQARLLLEPRSSHAALGLGFISAQRSTSNANMNGVGLGLQLLPATAPGASFYGSAFVYPHLQFSGTSSAFTTLDAGVIFAPKKRGGLFFQAGAFSRNGLPASSSPTSIAGLTLGIGSAF